jgi:hypothetical protein
MTTSDTHTNKKSFFNKYPKWTYWFAALLIIELIIVLSVVYGYILPRKQKLKQSASECGYHYSREIGYCKPRVSYCIKECNTNDPQCLKNCITKNENYSGSCTSEYLSYYDRCIQSSIDYWY